MGAGGAGAKYDDNFYDLDDDFIDDGDLEDIDQDEDMELFADGDTSKFQSGRESVVPKASNGDEDKGVASDKDEGNEQSYDPDQERQKRRYNKLLQNFRILMPDEVEEMLKEDEQKKLEKSILMPKASNNGQQLTITGMINPVTPNPIMKTSSAGGLPMTSPMISQAPDKTPTTAL